MEELLDRLKLDGKQIGEDGDNGNEKANNVMKYYAMWHSCPGDKCSFALCNSAYDEWKKEKAAI